MCGGQILMNELLKRFVEGNTQKIELQALRNSPFSPISVYRKLGFSCVGGDNYTENMRINRERAIRALTQQDKFLTTTTLYNQPEEDLMQTLNLQCKEK